MANAVYQEDPTNYLSSSLQHHTIHTVCAASEHSAQGIMLAVGKVNNLYVLYSAFRGTKTWKDAMADADIEQSHRGDIPGGTFHSGFERNAKVLPVKQLLFCAEQNDCQTLVFAVRLFCNNQRFDQQMLHYSGHQDIVPGILSLGHTLSELKHCQRHNGPRN